MAFKLFGTVETLYWKDTTVEVSPKYKCFDVVGFGQGGEFPFYPAYYNVIDNKIYTYYSSGNLSITTNEADLSEYNRNPYQIITLSDTSITFRIGGDQWTSKFFTNYNFGNYTQTTTVPGTPDDYTRTEEKITSIQLANDFGVMKGYKEQTSSGSTPEPEK